MQKVWSSSLAMRCLLLALVSGAISACDFYEDEINDDWSLCAADDPNLMMLCRNLGEGSHHGVLERVMVAWGYNGQYISLKRCLEGQEYFYSVVAQPAPLYDDPEHLGPLNRNEWQQAMLDEPEFWPVIDEVWVGLEKRHCPKVK